MKQGENQSFLAVGGPMTIGAANACKKGDCGARCYERDCAECSAQRSAVQEAWRRDGGVGLMLPAVLCINPESTVFDLKARSTEFVYHLGLARNHKMHVDAYGSGDHGLYMIELSLPEGELGPVPLGASLDGLDIYLRDCGQSFYVGTATDALLTTSKGTALMIGACIDAPESAVCKL